MTRKIDRCPYCSPDCFGLAEHHGDMGCLYCHCMHNHEDVLHSVRPPSSNALVV
jgi:hypothetical protein